MSKDISTQNIIKLITAGIVFLAICTSLHFHSSKENKSTAIVSSLYSHSFRTVKEICQETKEEKTVIPEYANEENYIFLPQEHYHIQEIQGTDLIPESGNPFWFPMEGNEKRIPVSCELNYFCGWFEGTGTLVIRALSEIMLNNCYEIILTDLEGEFPFGHDHESITDSDCPYSGNFGIGYYYITDNQNFEFLYRDETLEMLSQWNTFPPDTEYLKKGMAGAHPFSYWRLVCSSTGFEDTYFESHEDEDSYELLWEGKNSGDRYHNLITVDGDERRYSLWPVTYGTQEHTYLTWKKGGGIVKYTSYAGNCRDMISFWTSGYEKYASMEEKQNIELWMEHWKGEYRFHECLGTAQEASAKFRDYLIRIYREGDQYYADISICGPDTKVSVKAAVYRIPEEYIAFFFLEYLPDHMTGTFSDADDHALLLLRQMGDEVYTYWEDITPMLEENEKPGIICFRRQ